MSHEGNNPNAFQLSDLEFQVVLDALNVRALDRQADEYGDAGSDAAADLYLTLTQLSPDENRSKVGVLS